MYKYKNIILVFLMCLSFTSVIAQHEVRENKELIKRWDVSFNIFDVWSFNADQEIPQLNLMVRYQTRHNQAIRFTPILALDKQFDKDSTGTKIFRANTTNLGARIGYEWQKNKGKTQLFYGSNLEYRYNFWRNVELNGVQPSGIVPLKGHDLVISPFVGLKYFFSSKFSVSAEAHFYYSYSYSRSYSFDLSERLNGVFNHSFKFLPLRFMNVSYHF